MIFVVQICPVVFLRFIPSYVKPNHPALNLSDKINLFAAIESWNEVKLILEIMIEPKFEVDTDILLFIYITFDEPLINNVLGTSVTPCLIVCGKRMMPN